MRASFHDLWGCARGPVLKLAPQTRLLVGTAAFAACMVAPATGLAGPAFVGTATVAWLAFCRPPLRAVRATLLLGLALLLPYYLLVPLVPAGSATSGASLERALAVPSSILVRGLAGMLVSLGTVAGLTMSDLREALARLPVPRLVSAILLQVVHQSASLFYETKSIAAAMAVRGATGGIGTAWRVLASLPQVWLPRITGRAERVAAAMELRGYCDGQLCSFRQARAGLADAGALALAALALACAVAIRAWGFA